jgi:putative ABC transport system permease protein
MVFPWLDAGLYAGLATFAAVFAAAIPAWKSTQTAPARELRDE